MEIGSDYTYKLLGCAYEVHRIIGSGLLEDVYRQALKHELLLNGFDVLEETPVEVNYKGLLIKHNLRLDLLVDRKVVLELKSVEELRPVFFKQLMTYMRLTNCHLGYLINFREARLKDGIHRVVDNFRE